ncbi:MAG: FAD-binding oxidoreductase [Notoacmeibacter sp.]|nr:FAD-binding oxidoreductase [Notoacmeibacter sp.]
MSYQSPISPGVSWYEATCGERPAYPALDGSATCDVLVIGGGFTGLSAAHRLAEKGLSVILLEQARIGDGASGRNGGQFGTGQRAWPEELEDELGLERARALFAMAEGAKRHVLDFAQSHSIDIDYVSGQLSVVHKARYLDDYRRHAGLMAERYDYPHIRYMDAAETAERLGSSRYLAGTRDTGTGHIHPLKLVIGLGRVAAAAGARICENTKVTKLSSSGGKVVAATPRGTITASKALVAVNAYGGACEPVSASHVMPIGSFIGATEPLPEDTSVIPGGESVDDSRFVVRYFRKSKDNRLLFGGREIYSANSPSEMEAGVRRQIAEVYPQLADVKLTHAWGGFVGITVPRKPFVREVMPGVTSIGGFSGHGVMLSNYTGRLYAETITGNDDQLRLLKDLKIPPFPGGRRFRAPLLFLALNWYALRDRL